ncbi:MAG: hypothetical protein ACK47B_24280 [Armatimonadota bacterium]
MNRFDEPIGDADTVETGRKGGAVAGTYAGGIPIVSHAEQAELGEAAYLGVSRVSWSAIWAALFIGTMTYLIMALLGAAIGMTWVNNDDVQAGTMRTAGLVWMLFCSAVSAFVGGFISGWMHRLPGKGNGAMNGLLYGSFSILFLSILGAIPIMQAVPTFANLFAQLGVGSPQIDPQRAATIAQNTAWWALGGILLALGISALGGYVGARRAPIDPLATGDAAHRH